MSHPAIHHTPEFGRQFNAWFNHLIPKPDDKIDKMKVSGPNGFLSAMLMLLWWGRRTLGGPGASVWVKAVEEVQKHITRMVGRPPKRKVSDVVLECEPTPAKKRHNSTAAGKKRNGARASRRK